jgi:hypothetical protein
LVFELAEAISGFEPAVTPLSDSLGGYIEAHSGRYDGQTLGEREQDGGPLGEALLGFAAVAEVLQEGLWGLGQWT